MRFIVVFVLSTLICSGLSSCSSLRKSQQYELHDDNLLDYSDKTNVAGGQNILPTQGSIDDIFENACRIRITAHRYFSGGNPVFEPKFLLEVRSHNDIKELKNALQVGELCSYPFSSRLLTITAFDEDEKCLGSLDCLGASYKTLKLRARNWRCEAYNAKPIALHSWLTKHQIGILDDYEKWTKKWLDQRQSN